MKIQPKPILHGRDHRPGGVDPIPGVGGIMFDTYPQAGQWLFVETDGPDTSPSGLGMEFLDTSGNGIDLTSGGRGIAINDFGSDEVSINNGMGRFGAPGVILDGGTYGRLKAQEVDVSSLAVGGIHVNIEATDATKIVVANDETITLSVVGGGTLKLSQSTGTSGGLLEFIDPLNNTILRVDTGHPSGPFSPEYHIKTGSSWVADL